MLKRISDEDCQLMGFNPKYARPDWMILQVLPIPPPPVRPSVMMDTSSRSEVSMSLSSLSFHFLHGHDLLFDFCWLFSVIICFFLGLILSIG